MQNFSLVIGFKLIICEMGPFSSYCCGASKGDGGSTFFQLIAVIIGGVLNKSFSFALLF